MPGATAATTHAVEQGFWFDGTLWSTEVADHTSTYVRLLALQRTLAIGMRARAAGEVQTALTLVQQATSALPRAMTRPGSDDDPGRRPALLPPPTPNAPELERLTYRTALVVIRERTELTSLRRRFTRRRPAEEELIDGCVDYLCRVEFVPTWTATSNYTELLRADPGRKHMHYRLDRLRRFGDPFAVDATFAAWRRLGGYAGLRGAALRSLAQQPLAEWLSTPGMSVIPVSHGRRAAWTVANGGSP